MPHKNKKGKDAPQERGPHKKRVSRERRRRRTKGARDLNIVI
jgi:hypothetical protein